MKIWKTKSIHKKQMGFLNWLLFKSKGLRVGCWYSTNLCLRRSFWTGKIYHIQSTTFYSPFNLCSGPCCLSHIYLEKRTIWGLILWNIKKSVSIRFNYGQIYAKNQTYHKQGMTTAWSLVRGRRFLSPFPISFLQKTHDLRCEKQFDYIFNVYVCNLLWIVYAGQYWDKIPPQYYLLPLQINLQHVCFFHVHLGHVTLSFQSLDLTDLEYSHYIFRDTIVSPSDKSNLI